MDNKRLKEIPINSFNEEGWLKVPLLMYLNLAILAKGLLIFVFSLASRGKSDQLLSIFFPDKALLIIAIGMSIVPILTFILLTISEIQQQLTLKKVLLSICFFQIVIEVLLLIKYIVESYHPFESSYFFVLLGYLLILFLSFTSFETKLFIQQLFKGKGTIEKATKAHED